jgi:hypothetical protein
LLSSGVVVVLRVGVARSEIGGGDGDGAVGGAVGEEGAVRSACGLVNVSVGKLARVVEAVYLLRVAAAGV